MIDVKNKVRKTKQYQLPVVKDVFVQEYDIYPVHNIGDHKIHIGYDTLAKELSTAHYIKIDGYVGIRFEDIHKNLTSAFLKLGIAPQWVDVSQYMKSEEAINQIVEPYLGGDDPVFGKIAHLEITDFFDPEKLKELSVINNTPPVIFYGTGAQLVPVEGKTVYFDISKNEIQFRSRAGSVVNLGASQPDDPKKMYKRFYFVDWVVLNRHKNAVKESIDYFVDGQRADEITWVTGINWRNAIDALTKSPLRVRPWFEPGAWGGDWIKGKIKGLAQDVVNYAWSFELIVPENGVILESSAVMLEFSFDFLMFFAGDKVLGDDFQTYGYEFPIRFDFLDTFNGGNLSIQCHPQKKYMQEHFGESITQEETYYILDNEEDALVYLGFQEGINPSAFRSALEESIEQKKEIDITEFVQVFKSEKHGLYLIPPGTIHGSGKNNLVLEISSTPYIYTFKMYDWLRVDLDGKPRPLNVERGMDNVVFDYSGEKIQKEFISSPVELERTPDYSIEHLPTHKEHLYDVHRFTIHTDITVPASGKAQVLSLVEGESIEIKADNKSFTFNYAESFVIPAAMGEYSIINRSKKPAMVVKGFIK